MPVHFAGIIKWFLAQAGGFLFNTVTRQLSENMGLSPRSLTTAQMETLLDKYFHQFEVEIIRRFDEDRLVTFNSAIKLIKTASGMAGMTELKKGYLVNAAGKFFDMTSLPPQGSTGGFSNTELICLAYLGIAAIHLEMNEPHADIARNIVTAVYADPITAKQWFGEPFINRLLTVCPQCGTENPPGTKHCKHDNYPLPVLSIAALPQGSYSQNISSLPRYCSKGHRNSRGSTTCANPTCGELITSSYCSLGHANPLGSTHCSVDHEPLASLF